MTTEHTPDRIAFGHEAQRLLAALLEREEEGRVQISTPHLLKATGLTQGALIRARTELTQNSLLRTETGFSSSGLRGANVYILNLEALRPVPPPAPEVLPASEPVLEPLAEEVQLLPEPVRPERKGFLGRFRRGGSPS